MQCSKFFLIQTRQSVLALSLWNVMPSPSIGETFDYPSASMTTDGASTGSRTHLSDNCPSLSLIKAAFPSANFEFCSMLDFSSFLKQISWHDRRTC